MEIVDFVRIGRIGSCMPDGDIFDNSRRGKWRKISRAYIGRQPFDYRVGCISEAIRDCVSVGGTAKAVGAAVAVLESTLKNQQQGGRKVAGRLVDSLFERYAAEWLRFSGQRKAAEPESVSAR